MPDLFIPSGSNRSVVLGSIESYGNTMTASATAHTKGAWTEMTAAAPFEVYGIWVSLHPPSSGATIAHLVDIGVGAVGSEVVLIANIGAQQAAVYVGNPLLIPIRIAAGQRISMRAQSNVGSAVIRALITLFGQPVLGDALESYCVTYGALTASSSVLTVDPGATANTTTFTEISAATTHSIHQVIFNLINLNITNRSTALWNISLAVGASGSEVEVIPEMVIGTGAIGDYIVPSTLGPFPVNIPAGTRLSIGCMCTIADTTYRLLGVELLALG